MDNFAKKLGKNIKILRVTLDMSQSDLAFAADINQSYLSKVENGTTNITVVKLCNVALAMKCNLIELLPAQNSEE